MSRADLYAAVQDVHAAAGGVLEIEIVRPQDLTTLMLQALAGNEQAAQLLRMTMDAVKRCATAPRRRPMLCATCPRPLRKMEFSVVIASPHIDQPEKVLAFGVCPKCGTTRDDLLDAAHRALGKNWPDIKPVAPIHHEGGRA